MSTKTITKASNRLPLNKIGSINKINKTQILRYLKKGGIPIITGFQGINNKNRIPIICINWNSISFVVKIIISPVTAKIAYTPIPIPWPIEVRMPAYLLIVTLFLIINAKLGPGDIAPAIHTKANWSQKIKVI